MDKYYCGTCDTRRTGRVVERELELQVKDELIRFIPKIRICDECGGECYDEELEQALFIEAYDIYRRHHNLIMPQELKELRENYGLSQRSLAALLGWGEVTVHRYENGSLPDEAHNQLLHLLKYPENMLRIVRMNGSRLPAASRKKLLARLEVILGDLEAIDRPKKTVPKRTVARFKLSANASAEESKKPKVTLRSKITRSNSGGSKRIPRSIAHK